MSTETIFEKIIYDSELWLDHPCGSGSTMHNTREIREQLVPIIQQYNITSMLDAPCGDYSWMSTIEFPQGFTYIGADIVQRMIDENSQRHPDINFMHLDVINDSLPSVDLMLVRDLLIHIPDTDILKLFANIKRAGIKWLLVSNYPSYSNNQNKNQTDAHARFYNLHHAPYNLSDAVETITENTTYGTRTLELFSVDQLPQ